MQSDLDYFRGRAQEEIDASLVAESTAGRRAHLDLARRYTELADAIEQISSVTGKDVPAGDLPA